MNCKAFGASFLYWVDFICFTFKEGIWQLSDGLTLIPSLYVFKIERVIRMPLRSSYKKVKYVIIFLEVWTLICTIFTLLFTKSTACCMSRTHELELCATMLSWLKQRAVLFVTRKVNITQINLQISRNIITLGFVWRTYFYVYKK